MQETRRHFDHRTLGIFAVIALASVQEGGSAPTTLYHFYQESWALSPLMLTLIFAAYPLSLLVALLTVGSLSDFVGRRPVMVACMLVSALAMGAFLIANSASTLIASRIIQGLATGMAASTLGATILDVHRSRGALINSVTAFRGTTIGAVGSSALVAYAPAPLHLVYAILLVAFLLQALAVRWMPETSPPVPGALASLRPHVAIPSQARRAFVLVSPVNIAGWALGGFYLSLMPSLLRVATGVVSPFTGGIVVAALTLSGSGTILLWRNWSARRILTTGASVLAIGVAVTLVGVKVHLVSLLMIGTIIAGIGFGASFFGAARTILPLAASHERAGLLSAFYVESYLAFSLPAIAVGLAAPHLGLALSTYVYGGVIILLALASLAAVSATGRGSRPGV